MSRFLFLSALLILQLPLSSSSSSCPPSPQIPTLQSYLPSLPAVKGPESICTGNYDTKTAKNSIQVEWEEGTKELAFDVTIVSSSSCSRISTATTEVWHATPEGNYSPLSGENMDCRGTYEGGSFLVNTLVPGSYGLFGGLGPMGVDIPPYGPKSIHFRVSAPGYKTLVTEVEIDGEGWTDWRGPSLVLGGKDASQLAPSLKLVLEPLPTSSSSSSEPLCSFLSLLNPYSFFTEPLALCSGGAIFKFFDM
ncbi:hypothetical protein TrST_g964 [Triparma strigata]|uniref:Intradiol ring-cleavage dioxygenases domain-containing protein n=1 Tax=Triparma strigata TaxID=1606541 RepID=A0A9W7C2W5_9STRA|nr:hypothetical protein TrST_g964 [Triparma strigata]